MNTDKFAAILTLLKRLEWTGRGRRYDGGEYEPTCAICGGSKPLNDGDDEERGAGHFPNCELQSMLRELEHNE